MRLAATKAIRMGVGRPHGPGIAARRDGALATDGTALSVRSGQGDAVRGAD